VFGSQWATNVLPLLPDNYSFDGVMWVDLGTVDGATGLAGRSAMTGGDVSAAGTPPSLGVLVRKNIAGSGRAKRSGRIFLPGNLENLVDENGVVSSGKLTQLESGLNALLTAFNTSAGAGDAVGRHLVVAHVPSVSRTVTKTVKVPNPDGIMSSDDITGFSAQTLASGIRRRVRA
jgi:hypothetical protein